MDVVVQVALWLCLDRFRRGHHPAFLMLAYNAVEWGNHTLRLVAQPVGTVNATLVYSALFWALLASAYALMVRRRSPGPLAIARYFSVDFAYAAAIPFALLASVVFYLTEGDAHLPLVLITPLSLLANLIHGAGGDRLVGPLPPARSHVADRERAFDRLAAGAGARSTAVPIARIWRQSS